MWEHSEAWLVADLAMPGTCTPTQVGCRPHVVRGYALLSTGQCHPMGVAVAFLEFIMEFSDNYAEQCIMGEASLD